MRYLKFALPLLLVALVDIFFHLGVWERLASPESHAGMSITKKRALQDQVFQHIDFVTLGSSRPVYGIDHELLAKSAAAHGYVHVNLSVPGTHWMSLGVISGWLARHHPEIRGGVIALAAQDFLAPGNGTYELGIAYPFHTLGDMAWMRAHVPFDWHDPATYGVYSALFQYHEDVQDYLGHPYKRDDVLAYFRALTPSNVLTSNADETGNLCAAHLSTVADCKSVAASGTPIDAKLDQQCKLVQSAASGRYDIGPFLQEQPLPEHLRKTRDMVRTQLRALNWPTPPIIVLMPMHSVWLKDAMPAAAREWALSVLAPLASEGKIHLLDYTDLFDDDSGVSDCSAFFDFYHNNVSGRERLMRQLKPAIEKDLYGSPEK
jgi:hypothetical protein